MFYFNFRFHFAFCLCSGIYIAIPFLFAFRIGNNEIIRKYYKYHECIIIIGDVYISETYNQKLTWLCDKNNIANYEIKRGHQSGLSILNIERIDGKKFHFFINFNVPNYLTTIVNVNYSTIDDLSITDINEFMSKCVTFITYAKFLNDKNKIDLVLHLYNHDVVTWLNPELNLPSCFNDHSINA